MTRSSQLVLVLTTVATIGTAATGCDGKPAATSTSPSASRTAPSAGSPGQTTSSPGSTPPPAAAADYTGLLIQAADIRAPEDFTAGAPILNPDGRAGVTTSFSNQDRTHVIYDTIEILADPSAAVRALNKRKGGLDGTVHGVPDPIAIGVGGTTVAGPSPGGDKGVTVLLFTEGRAFVELEFDGPARAPAPPDFVADVGQRQDDAIKKGL